MLDLLRTIVELIASDNTGYSLINTGVATDDSEGGTNSNGGFKCYEGATLATDIDHDGESTTANVTSFSYCGFSFGAPGVTFLTLNTGQTVTVTQTLFGDTGNNLVCTSAGCSPAFRNAVSSNGGVVTMFRSSGSSAGSLYGEFNDGGDNDTDGAAGDGIIWTGPVPIYWLGPSGVTQTALYSSAFKTNTAVFRKWSDSDNDGNDDNRGWSLSPTAYVVIDPDATKIPGKTAGFDNFDIYVPSTCSTNLLIDDNYTITGGYFFLEAFSSTKFYDGATERVRYGNRSAYLEDGMTLTLGGDFSNTGSNRYYYNWVGGYFYAGTNTTCSPPSIL